MTDIVRRASFVPTSNIVRVDRQTNRALAYLRGDALLRDAEEMVAAHLAQSRIDAAHRIGSRTVLELKGLHSLISEVTRDDPGLELELRQIEAIISIGSQQVLVNFMTRPL
jgi:hypothetical protein